MAARRFFLCASAAAFTLGACASAPKNTAAEQALIDDLTATELAPSTMEARAAIRRQDPITQAAFWAEEYENAPADRDVALEFARSSRAIGRPARAVMVANQALALHPDDHELLSVLGVALIEDGRAPAAIEPLQRAVELEGHDPWSLNYLGAALDQSGRHEEARIAYMKGVSEIGETPLILSNIGLSYALEGDPEMAEEFLRRAAALPGADARVRQNLALALALQGRFDEAEVIALQDVSAQTAQANVEFVRSMITRPRRWDTLRGETYD